jgi:hypothetical protein
MEFISLVRRDFYDIPILSMVDPKGVEDVKLVVDVYFSAHASSSSFASTLIVGGFCCSTVSLGHLFLIKTISSCY